MMFGMRTRENVDRQLLAKAKVEAATASERESFAPPTDGGSGLRPEIVLEDTEQLADVLGDNLPHHAARVRSADRFGAAVPAAGEQRRQERA